MKISSWLAMAIVSIPMTSPLSHAGMALSATRLVVEESKNASISVKNTGDEPWLAQSWIQQADADGKPATELWVSPPIMRIDGQREAILRISPLDTSGLPKDAESLFWLNVQQIPMASDEKSEARIAFAIKQRIKVFYRPKGLNGSSFDAIKAMSVTVLQPDTDHWQVTINNTSAFHLNVAQITVMAGSKEIAFANPVVVKPRDHVSLTIQRKSDTGKDRGEILQFNIIDDFGGTNVQEKKL